MEGDEKRERERERERERKGEGECRREKERESKMPICCHEDWKIGWPCLLRERVCYIYLQRDCERGEWWGGRDRKRESERERERGEREIEGELESQKLENLWAAVFIEITRWFAIYFY